MWGALPYTLRGTFSELLVIPGRSSSYMPSTVEDRGATGRGGGGGKERWRMLPPERGIKIFMFISLGPRRALLASPPPRRAFIISSYAKKSCFFCLSDPAERELF